MELPIKLQSKVIDFLKSLPNIDDTKSRRAFIYSLGLDSKLKEQIPFDEPPAQFIPIIVSKLLQYGKLIDGRYAIIAILEESQRYIGKDRQVYCKQLIREIYSQKSTPVNEQVDDTLAEIHRNLLIAKASIGLKESLYKVETYLSTSPYNIEARLLKDRIIQAIEYEKSNKVSRILMTIKSNNIFAIILVLLSLLIALIQLYPFIKRLWEILF